MKDPWSVPLRLGEIGSSVSRILVPDEVARKRIARDLGLVELASLEAEVVVEPWLDGATLRGAWQAAVVQTCGVTLERLETRLADDFELKVVPADSPHAPSLEAQLAYDPEAPEPPDVLEGDVIDLAAYVVEHLALAVDPFPRKPGVEFEAPDMGRESSPFDVLKKLQKDD